MSNTIIKLERRGALYEVALACDIWLRKRGIRTDGQIAMLKTCKAGNVLEREKILDQMIEEELKREAK